MAEKEPSDKHSTGEILLFNLFRLIQVVKIHQSNNRLFAGIVAFFRDALTNVWSSGRPAAFSLYRGRFYLNDERIVYTPSMWATSVKMSEFFQERGLNGLKFDIVDDLTDDMVVSIADILNKSKRFPDPYAWLTQQLTDSLSFVIPSKDEDNKSVGGNDNQASEGGRTNIYRTEGQAEINRQARQVYSQGLTVLRAMIVRLSEGKKAGIQKAKRVVQELIDLMKDNYRLYLALSTVRDQGDQLFTHSLNVAVLSMAIGQRLGYTKAGLEHLGMVALFHDFGKTHDFMSAAEKPEALEGHDLALIQNHTLGSIARIVRLNASHSVKMSMLLPVNEHHMGLDFTGYPKTKRTRPLSLSGRILAVADQYDAMTSWRPWRETPLSPPMAIKTMANSKGQQLDPSLLKLFIEILGPWPVGSILVLNTRQLALTEASLPGEGPYPPAFLLVKNANGTVNRGENIDLSGKNGTKPYIIGTLSPVAYGLQAADYLL
ncbi:MAG: HD domain-containing protein [Deltaproteobacteria bacterium]|nr:HD domain-containing protein [Deltaproteobacteria bacterium]